MSKEKELERLADLYNDPEIGLTNLKNTVKLARDHNLALTANQVREWYNNRENVQMKKRVPQTYYRIQDAINEPSISLQADLMEINRGRVVSNRNMRYILTVIDIVSKKLWAYALPNKRASTVLAKIKLVYNEIGFEEGQKFTVDEGSEFSLSKKYLEKNGVRVYSSIAKGNTAVVERVNRTLWERIQRVKSKNFVDKLPAIVRNYNNTIHRTIKAKPNEVHKGEKPPAPLQDPPPELIKIGMSVRHQLDTSLFDKATTKDRWSKKIYVVKDKVLNRWDIGHDNLLFLSRELQPVANKPIEVSKRNDEREKARILAKELMKRLDVDERNITKTTRTARKRTVKAPTRLDL